MTTPLNLGQVYTNNPITLNTSTDLMYFAAGGTTDAAMTFANFSNQFVTTVDTNSGSASVVDATIGILGGSTGLTFSGSGNDITLGGTLDVGNGGTGLASATAYAVLCGGTSSSGAFQSVASVGTSGQVLTSNGAGELPTFQNATGGTTPTLMPYFDATQFFPSVSPIGTTFSPGTQRIFFVYMGYVTKTTTFNQVYAAFTAIANTVDYSFGLCSSPSPPDKAGQTLTLLGASAGLTTSTAGVITNASGLNVSVAAGTYLWAAISNQSTSTATVANSCVDYGKGNCLTFTGDYLNSGTTSWSASLLTPSTSGVVSCPYLMIST